MDIRQIVCGRSFSGKSCLIECYGCVEVAGFDGMKAGELMSRDAGGDVEGGGLGYLSAR